MSKQPAELFCTPMLFASSGDKAIELPLPLPSPLVVLLSLIGSTGTITNPNGRRGMQDGSSPLIAS